MKHNILRFFVIVGILFLTSNVFAQNFGSHYEKLEFTLSPSNFVDGGNNIYILSTPYFSLPKRAVPIRIQGSVSEIIIPSNGTGEHMFLFDSMLFVTRAESVYSDNVYEKLPQYEPTETVDTHATFNPLGGGISVRFSREVDSPRVRLQIETAYPERFGSDMKVVITMFY